MADQPIPEDVVEAAQKAAGEWKGSAAPIGEAFAQVIARAIEGELK